MAEGVDVTELPVLPMPPSVNAYWRSIGRGRVILSANGRAYRETVQTALFGCGVCFPEGPLSVRVRIYRPDNRRRDLDNAFKGLFDSIKYAGVYADDSQIEHIDARLLPKNPAHPKGATFVWVGPLISE